MVAVIPPVGPAGVTAPVTRDRYGLFSVAERETLPAHASLGGVQFITGNCGYALGYEVQCAPSLAAKDFENEPSFETGTPFVVYATRECGPVGFAAEESQRLTLQKLKASEQGVVERIFSEQLFGQSPGLANNPAAVAIAPPAGTNFAGAIALLEAEFYEIYGQQGVIHVPLYAGTHMGGEHLIYADSEHPMPGNSRVWRTAVGSAVSIGNYSGKSILGADPAPGHAWIYMTPPVKIWSQPDSAVTVSPLEGALNRSTNQETWLAERSYVVAFECDAVLAVDATLPTQTTS